MINDSESKIRHFLTKVVFNWQQANRIAFITLFICVELLIQLSIFSLILSYSSFFSKWLNVDIVYNVWLFCIKTITIFICILSYSYYETNKSIKDHKLLQFFLVFVYLGYMGYLYVALGVANIFTGITVVSSAIIGILLLHRRVSWYAFLAHTLFIVGLLLIQVFGYNFKGFHTGISVSNLNSFEGTFFWSALYLILSIPKALFSIMLSLHLIKGVDDQLREAQFNADYDSLTKIKNRRSMMKHIYQVLFSDTPNCNCIDRKNNHQDFSVILLDIDFFKAVNDTHGHYSGDLVLIEVAKRLEEMMTGCCFEASRYGGEEFLLVLPQTNHQTAMKIAKRIHKHLSDKPYKIVDKMSIDVTASFGVSTLPDEDVLELRNQSESSSRNINTKKNKNLFKRQLKLALHNKVNTIEDEDEESSMENVNAYIKDGYEALAIENLINMADGALYDAKRMGRNQVVSAHHYIDADVSRNKIIISQIKADEILFKLPFEIEQETLDFNVPD